MKVRELLYWLQGAFEINDDQFFLTAPAAGKLQEKLSKVDKKQADPQVIETIGYIKALTEEILAADRPVTQKRLSDKIKVHLNDIFVHAIEPSIKGDQKPQQKKGSDIVAC